MSCFWIIFDYMYYVIIIILVGNARLLMSGEALAHMSPFNYALLIITATANITYSDIHTTTSLKVII